MLDGLGSMEKANALYLAIILIVVLIGAGSLRHVGFRRGLGMAAAWVGIFAAILVAVSYRDDAASLFGRLRGEVDPAGGRVQGEEFLVKARDDGHFWVRGAIDGTPVLFLVDTGASGIVLTAAAADRVGIDRAQLTFDEVARTANGTVRGATTRVGTIEVGPIVRTNMPVSVTQGELDTNLLGMAFLRTLGGWRVEGDVLILRP